MEFHTAIADAELMVQCNQDRDKNHRLALDACLFSCNGHKRGKCASVEECSDDREWRSKPACADSARCPSLPCSAYALPNEEQHRFCSLEANMRGVFAEEACPAACHTCNDDLLDLANPPIWLTNFFICVSLLPFFARALETAAVMRVLAFVKGANETPTCCCCCPAGVRAACDMLCCVAPLRFSRLASLSSGGISPPPPPQHERSPMIADDDSVEITVNTSGDMGQGGGVTEQQQQQQQQQQQLDVDSVWHLRQLGGSSAPAQVCSTAGEGIGLALRRLLTWHLLGPAVYLIFFHMYYEVNHARLMFAYIFDRLSARRRCWKGRSCRWPGASPYANCCTSSSQRPAACATRYSSSWMSPRLCRNR